MKKIYRLFFLAFILLFSAILFKNVYARVSDYPEVYDLRWSNRTAKWSVDGYADRYEIRLYRDDRRVFTKTVTSRSRNFTSEMSRGTHEYYFEVRPFNYEYGWGNWEQSDTVYIKKTSSNYNNNRSISPLDPIEMVPVNPTVPSVPTYPGYGPGEGPSMPSPQIIYNPVGQWVSQNGFWKFLYSNGVYASNSWILLGDKWYYVDANTNMAIGLLTIGQSTYYFYQDGSMATGTIILNGITHYFDGNGKMVY